MNMSGFKLDASKFYNGMAEKELKTLAALKLYGETAGQKLEAYAKKNRPWKDHTSNAKNSIQGGADWHGDKIDVYVSGNTNYFPRLEFDFEKRFSVLWPTIEMMSPEILRGMNNLLNK